MGLLFIKSTCCCIKKTILYIETIETFSQETNQSKVYKGNKSSKKWTNCLRDFYSFSPLLDIRENASLTHFLYSVFMHKGFSSNRKSFKNKYVPQRFSRQCEHRWLQWSVERSVLERSFCKGRMKGTIRGSSSVLLRSPLIGGEGSSGAAVSILSL